MNSTADTPADVLLHWASENETGSWHDFRHAVATCLANSDSKTTAVTLATRLSDLGHIDVDWAARSWSVGPPVLAVARGMGLCAYLAGWRTAWLKQRFAEATDHLNIFPVCRKISGAPIAMFAKCESTRAIEELAKVLQVRLLWEPSAQIAEVIPQMATTDFPIGAAPMAQDKLELFNSSTGYFNHVQSATAEGLYRFELHGRKQFRLKIEGDWRIVDRANGMLSVLQGQTIFRWHPPSPKRHVARAVTVPRWLSLPALAERSLVAATGLLPKSEPRRRIYLNVTRETATRIANTLGVRIEKAPAPLESQEQGAS